MSRVILSAGLREDFDRIFDFLFEYVPDHAGLHIEAIIDALDVLASSPLIGRPVAFAGLRVEEMAAPVIAALLADTGLGAEAVDEVISADALGAGGNPARRIALAAGLPLRVAGLSIDRQCAGGLDALAGMGAGG